MRCARIGQDLFDLGHIQRHLLGDLFGRGRDTMLVRQPPYTGLHIAQHLALVARQGIATAQLIQHRTANLRVRVRRELQAAFGIPGIRSLQEADHAVTSQVLTLHAVRHAHAAHHMLQERQMLHHKGVALRRLEAARACHLPLRHRRLLS